MEINLTLTEDERHACRRAAMLLRALAGGLREIGTRQEADACAAYAATLDRSSPAAGAHVNSDGKVDVERGAFILEDSRRRKPISTRAPTLSAATSSG